MDATQYQINALTETRERLSREVNAIRNKPARPWRGETFFDEEREAKEALRRIDDQIIELEWSLRDPEQDAEIRAELYAEMAFNGVHDDVSLYMHTPHQERRFQEQIMHDVTHGYFHPDDGWVEGTDGHEYEGHYRCVTCRGDGYDDYIIFDGEELCQECLPDIAGLFIALSMIVPTTIVVPNESRYADEYTLKRAA